MFEIVNEVAYGGQMLNCTPEWEELRLAGSHWIDVPGASSKPNLLNVAVSRARRRLYAIGDREAWSRLEHFDVLAARLEPVVVSV
ncbi:MAG TPA: hypothetical protein VN845_02995 [Solirubrobacteraceae bacterium]|nr:hypothetical protein [Solirubrobacteraceae bacterium]